MGIFIKYTSKFYSHLGLAFGTQLKERENYRNKGKFNECYAVDMNAVYFDVVNNDIEGQAPVNTVAL